MTKPSQNKEWGFFGTVNGDQESAWNAAFEAVQASTGADDDQVRRFLDSRRGRHLADDVNCDGLAGAIAKWEAWKPGKTLQRDVRVPKGATYLAAEVFTIGV